jgi:hypothetical protein
MMADAGDHRQGGVAASLFQFRKVTPDGTAVLTEEARRRMEPCKKICIGMATGVSGAGKRTSLNQFVRPVHGGYDSLGVFPAGDGLDAVTDVDFMAVGPIPLNEWLDVHRPIDGDREVVQLLSPQEGDEELSMFLVDTRGTGAFEDI